MTVHLTSNTEKEYRCIQCGSDSVNIIREGADPRLKCNGCQMLFDGSQAKAAEKAGAIPDKAPEPIQATVPTEAASNPREVPKSSEPEKTSKQEQQKSSTPRIPREPAFVFISRDRKEVEFVTEKELVARTLNWQSRNKNYDLYQLNEKKSTVKVTFE